MGAQPKPPSGGSGISNKELGYELRKTRALESIAQSLVGIHTELARIKPEAELPDYGTPPGPDAVAEFHGRVRDAAGDTHARGVQDAQPAPARDGLGLYFPSAEDSVAPMGSDDL